VDLKLDVKNSDDYISTPDKLVEVCNKTLII